MPTVEFSFSELCTFLGKEYEPDELMDRISMLGVGLEKIDKQNLVIEIFPNRPDLLSIEGFSRALKGLLDLETNLPKYTTKNSNVKLLVDPGVRVVRPHIVGGIVKNISIDDNFLISLMNIQEKLHLTHGRNRQKVAIGVHDLSKVQPPFTYLAVSPGEISFIPLDMDKELTLGEILEQHTKGREYAFTLAGKKKYPIIVDKGKQVISFPPIINGELTRVTKKTTELFIDVTGWDQQAVKQALNIIILSLADRGGKIFSIEILEK